MWLEELMPYIRRQAEVIVARGARAAVFSAEDLVQVAATAVLRARRRFDPRRGASWRTYALARAHGAMLDELRELDPMPRGARQRAKAAGVELPKILQEGFSKSEGWVSMDRPSTGLTPPEFAERSDFWRRIEELLKPRWARAVRLYYERGLLMTEIGAELGVGESRVCQLLRKSLQTLRRRMEAPPCV